jgi:alpha-glucosidase
MHDFGYDVADYVGIHPIFGTMEEFDLLLAQVHQRGMKLILDLVPNHTSDEHPWFVESRSSRDNPKRDWYIWRDPAPGGGPPNNWLSFFGGPAWTYDAKTRQYYLHQFVTQQPELNYRHPDVLPAMLDVMRFWLDKGVDGFRVDVIWLMLKDEQLRDEPPNLDWDRGWPNDRLLHIHTQNLPGVHDLIRLMRAVLDEYDDRVMIGEIYLPVEELVKYYGQNLDECHLPFNFHLVETPERLDWQARAIHRFVDAYEDALPPGGWPNWVLGNHDRARVATRLGVGQARVAAMLLLTLRGTPTIYYGEEIGMENVPIPPQFVQDPPAVNQPELAAQVGRDPVRTPMQWDASPCAGFSVEGATPWLPLAEGFAQHNVEQQDQDPASMLNLYRVLIHLRGTEPSLSVGNYRAVETGDGDLYAYLRAVPGGDRFLIVLNFGTDTHTLDLGHVSDQAQVAVATGLNRRGAVELSALDLGPNEGLILRLP